jgi:hypothetical protein
MVRLPRVTRMNLFVDLDEVVNQSQ